MRDISKLSSLCLRLVRMQQAPEPGLITWELAVAKLVQDIAEEALSLSFGELNLFRLIRLQHARQAKPALDKATPERVT